MVLLMNFAIEIRSVQCAMTPIKEEVLREHAENELEYELHSIRKRLEIGTLWHSIIDNELDKN